MLEKSEIMIRKIKSTDQSEFMKMGNDFYRSSAVEDKINIKTIRQTFKHIIKDGPYIKGYFIMIENNIAGFFTVSFAFSTEYGGNIILFEDLYIKDEYQGQGIGTKIFDYVEEEYKDKVMAIKLEVSKVNKRAFKLYTKLGYFENKYVSMLKVI